MRQLRTVLESLERKANERAWLKHQSTGELDDGKLLDGLAGPRGWLAGLAGWLAVMLACCGAYCGDIRFPPVHARAVLVHTRCNVIPKVAARGELSFATTRHPHRPPRLFMFTSRTQTLLRPGERHVFKRRGDPSGSPFKDPSAPSDDAGKTRLYFAVDVSGSMYRFNGADGRLERLLECTMMVGFFGGTSEGRACFI